VANLSALEGTIVDDLSTSMDNDLIFKISVPLRGDKVASPVCERKEIHLFFITLGDLDKHLSSELQRNLRN
jgi:hypothetical protein